MSAPVAAAPASPSVFGEVFLRLKPHMAALDAMLRSQVEEFEPEVRAMADYCIDTSGKRIRPALIFLSGSKGELMPTPSLVQAAAVVELVHLATLVHDDMMDNAVVRRSRETAAKAYGPEASVLLGDCIFAHALHLAAQFPTTEVCLAVSMSTRRVCAGEIIQTLRRGTTTVGIEDYYRVIDLKTAELFRVACHLGAMLAGFDRAMVDASAAYGRHLGIAYQIYDDLADYFGDEKRIGKTLGTDLASGKLTLPLFRLLDCLPEKGREELLAEIRGEHPPQFAQRIMQMRRFGIFDQVADAIDAELAKGHAALAPWLHMPSAQLLLELSKVLSQQVGALRPVACPEQA